jgi:hypothetical protein
MATEAATSTVYLSYAPSDKKVADQILRRLRVDGFGVFDPIADVRLGENWAQAISQGLEQARAMVILLSPDSVKSPNVLHEIGFALGSKNFDGRVLPVIVKPTAEIPWFLQTMKYLRITHGDPGLQVARALKQVMKKASE